MSKHIQSKDLDMVDDVYGAMMTEAPTSHKLIIWALTALFFSFLIWAYFSHIDQVTTGSGKVIPSSQIQLIQSLDGGVLLEMHVKEGMMVKKGQALARIDATRFRSDLAQQEQEVSSLNADVIRLQAELRSIDITNLATDWREQIKITPEPLPFPDSMMKSHPNMVENQRQEYKNRLDNLSNHLEIETRKIQQRQQEVQELASKIKTLTKSYQLVNRELDLTRPLAQKGIVPEVELLKLQRTVNDIQGELSAMRILRPKVKSIFDEAILTRREHTYNYIADTREELNDLQSKLLRINEAQVGTQDKVSKAEIISPVNGTIKTVNINTLGGVVKPGENIIEIVPTDDQLLIETKILPKDIAFLYPGLPAIVKITAYDFTRYGGLNGTVEHISADTTQDEEGNSFYLAIVKTDQSSLTKDDGTLMPIIPGMLTTVDVITGQRSILEYILNPILRAKDTALRER